MPCEARASAASCGRPSIDAVAWGRSRPRAVRVDARVVTPRGCVPSQRVRVGTRRAIATIGEGGPWPGGRVTIVAIMKLAPAVLLGALGSMSACFEDPLPIAETESTGAAGSGSSSATLGPPTTGPDPDSTSATEPTTTTGSGSTSSGPGESTGEPPLACIDGVLDPPLGIPVAMADTAPAGDDFTGSCGGAGSSDVAYQWDVPYDGFFVLDTQGSDFDTLLYLYDDCGGNELWCNDNAEDTVSSRVVAPFEQGERVLVVVDGNAGESGQAVLNIDEVQCPSADLTGQALPAQFSNAAGDSAHGGGCGGEGNPERAFRWQAAQAGLYAFVADSGAFPPAVYLERGPICDGPRIACNGAAFGHSEVMRVIEAGEYVTIIVDSQGGTGNFDIDIVPLAEECPGAALGMMASGNIDAFPNTMSSSCGPSGYMQGAMFYPHGDATYSWTSPGMVGSNSGCDITVTSDFPVALSLQEGTCDGPEVQCEQGMFDPTIGQYQATVSVGHIPPTDFTVSLSRASEPFVGAPAFWIEVGCWAVA